MSNSTLHIVPNIFGIWPLGKIETFLNNRRFAIRTFSNFRILGNSTGKSKTSNLFETD